MVLFAYLQQYCRGILRNLSMAELSKALKKANSRLNTTWNTTQCKAASFFLFSLRLLLTKLPYTFRYTHFSSVCAFQDSCTRVAPRVLHFSAFIIKVLKDVVPKSRKQSTIDLSKDDGYIYATIDNF